jgi:hypothetical protein
VGKTLIYTTTCGVHGERQAGGDAADGHTYNASRRGARRSIEMDDQPTNEAESKAARQESVERQMPDSNPANPGQTASPANESPARDEEVTDDAPETPHGVGESITTRGEDQSKEQEAGREDLGTKGPTERPVGTSTARDRTSIDPQGPGTPGE